jgi:hypothetical protein
MFPGDNRGPPRLPRQPGLDPTIPGDGRPEHERRFINFPDNPDLYGRMDPYARPGTEQPPPQRGRPLGNFAPPGEIPAFGSPTNPMFGFDGQGGLIVTSPRQANRGMRPRGDYDEMIDMGIIGPPIGPPPGGLDRGGFGPGGFGGGGFRGGGFGGGGFGML